MVEIAAVVDQMVGWSVEADRRKAMPGPIERSHL